MAFNGRAVLGSVIGAGLGAAAWVAIAYFANYEIGWIAWGIGLLAGFGYKVGQGGGGVMSGSIAAVIAISSILAAKMIVIQLQMGPVPTEATLLAEYEQDEELTVSYIADEVVVEYESQDKPLNWPEDSNRETPESAGDYPADVWTEAQAKWSAMSSEEKQIYRQALAANNHKFVEASYDEISRQAFKSSFGLMDIVFFLLATVTAFKIAADGTETG